MSGKPDREPVCGEDFCDRCGDCLACYGGDPCYPNDEGPHQWVEYDPADATGRHPVWNVLYPDNNRTAGEEK